MEEEKLSDGQDNLFYNLEIYKTLQQKEVDFKTISVALRHPKKEIRELAASHASLVSGQRITVAKSEELKHVFYSRSDLTVEEIEEGFKQGLDMIALMINSYNSLEILKRVEKYIWESEILDMPRAYMSLNGRRDYEVANSILRTIWRKHDKTTK